jgi:hypothetical protein
MQWLIAASPGHPFLAAVIEEVLSNIHRYRPLRSGVGKRAVFYTTGPVAFTCAIAPIVTRYPHRKIDAIKEGWRYTVLNSAVDHHRFSSVHYSKLSSPVVLAPTGQSKVKKMLYVAESFIAALIGKISVINHDRIKRRRARRMPAR